ncbi:MAG TPA: helix-turn-helix transcriptional regulator [Mesorhizobium sp.]|jgi:transcriptional regulator with XRE-family HTH domain|uniref:helix-turn-helix domain-containing protein n=1 Tax=Mesorhizobium sp. TaxID=1871066 RepID=UPI002DDD4FB6|nr:helix-turn-helix transcriptional regulator [Mesorhizobium sp.]HEV2505481.1 helix-turn-helix transcriptional regulator [Mesorhizobium sp.]
MEVPVQWKYRRLLANRLKELRTAKGIDQLDLALKAGLSRRGVGGLERMERTPTLDMIVVIAAALDVEPHLLISPACETGQDAEVLSSNPDAPGMTGEEAGAWQAQPTAGIED